ncbi:MAG: response regulator transcription factor [Bacillota bacterium]|nr:response regulator transcription factor [Bacillota bacterium]
METILIVDDEHKITRILDLQLKHSGYNTLVANDARLAVKIALEQEVDLVLMDIMMPFMNGIEAMNLIKEKKPNLPIILLTAKDDTEDIVEGLDRGADEYVTKPFVFEELSARIRTRLRQSVQMKHVEAEQETTVIEYREIAVDTVKFEVSVSGQPISLSKTEFDLLLYLIKHKGKVISREELLQNVWGYSYGGSNIVDVYINYLREKISRHTDSKIIETVRGRGYMVQ